MPDEPAAKARNPVQAMQRPYRLRVQGPDGRQGDLHLMASHATEAERLGAARGCVVLSIEALPTHAQSTSASAPGEFSLLLFSQELLALLDAGLSLTEALTTLSAKERQPWVRRVLDGILDMLAQGHPLSQALAQWRAQFPEVFVATIRACERTGNLPHALQRYIAYQQHFDGVRKKLISVSIYPAMLVSVGALVMVFLIGYVVPRFAAVYQTAGRDLPWLSGLLLDAGLLVHQHGSLVGLAALLGTALAVVAATHPAVRARLTTAVLSLPWVAYRATQHRRARFYRGVGLLVSSGVPLPRALEMSDGVLAPLDRSRLHQARQLIDQGHKLADALTSQHLTDPVTESLIKVGERSGQLAAMLDRAASFQDDDFLRWIDWATRLLEPILMLAIGFVIGGIVLLLYMPIFDLAGGL